MSSSNSLKPFSTAEIYHSVLQGILDFFDITREQTIKLITLLQQKQNLKNLSIQNKNPENELEMVDAAENAEESHGKENIKPVFFSPQTPHRIDQYHAFITDCPSPNLYANLVQFQNVYQSFSLEPLDSSEFSQTDAENNFSMETFVDHSKLNSDDNETCPLSKENRKKIDTEENKRWSQKTLVDFTLPSAESREDKLETIHFLKKAKFDDSPVNDEARSCKETPFLNVTTCLKKILNNALSHGQSRKTTRSSNSNDNMTTTNCRKTRKPKSPKNKKLRKVSSFASVKSFDIHLLDMASVLNRKKGRGGRKCGNREEIPFEDDSEDGSTLIDLDEYTTNLEEDEEYIVIDSQEKTLGLIDFNNFVENQKISEDKIENARWLFNFYDKDNDGLIDPSEMNQIIYEIYH
ncbi:6487_t:CDS:2 [Acaulospora morrowiae]|uniref:6487_t:CDS:1 n=1 Tax=Acaulospora morrowiae TaxID=94023 RepID=A0A9N9N8B5_9GLOM|nr:6487_t:CDS:2 [Acaulospora morrowiae]